MASGEQNLLRDLLGKIPLGKIRGPTEELLDSLRSPFLSSIVYPDNQKIKQRWQLACMDKQKVPD